MRIPALFLAALAAGVSFAAARATERPSGGVYVSLTTPSAAACARACADDGICMSWTQRSNGACELSAVIASAPPADAIATGLAARAPMFAQRQTPMLHPAPAIEGDPLQPPAGESEAEAAQAESELMLLGGPDDGDLRLRLGAPR